MAARISPIVTHRGLSLDCGKRDGCVTAAVYGNIEEEYRCVRERVALQDLSHYGKISVSGDAALDLVNHLIVTDLARLPINQLQSSFMLDDDGKPVCELLIANLGTQYLLLSEGAAPATVTAALNAAAEKFPGVVISDRTEALGLVSTDGPYSWELLKAFLGLGIIGTRYLEVVPNQQIGGLEVTLCRAGKTGEYGYLLMCDPEQTVALWDALTMAGEKFNLLPIGYDAVDLCKMENRNVNQHREGASAANVLELNTRTMLGRDKDDYVGRVALQSVIDAGLSRRLVGMTFDEALPADNPGISAGADIGFGQEPIGRLVNAGYSFGLKRWIGLALIDEEFACVGVSYGVRTEAGIQQARTVSAPFLFNRSLTIRPQEDSYFA